MSPWLARRWYNLVFISSYLGFGILHSLRVVGRRNMPSTGPVLVIANHQSFFDPVLCGLASRRYLCYLARETLFRNPFFANIIRSLDAIPIDNQGFSREGINATLNALHRGLCVVIFAEGERTADGEMVAFKPGITLLLKKAKCPIVPIGIAGAYDSWPRHRKVPRIAPLWAPPAKGSISLSVGKPIASEAIAHLPREEQLQRLFDAVAAEKDRAERINRGRRKRVEQ